MTVYKYQLPIDDRARVLMPSGAELLCVAMQHGRVTVWARVDPSATMVTRQFRVAGTGHPGVEGSYIGTVFPGPLVFHVFDLGEV